MATETETCCPRFEPEPWDEQELHWDAKLFVKDRVRSFLHIPLNFSGVMKKNAQLIEAADAMPDEMIVLSDENSLWGADVYIAVSGDVPGAHMAKLSGDFLTRVFEGPYKDVRKWVGEMTEYVTQRGKKSDGFYFYYTTCPTCAKKYGKNYVVLLAKI